MKRKRKTQAERREETREGIMPPSLYTPPRGTAIQAGQLAAV